MTRRTSFGIARVVASATPDTDRHEAISPLGGVHAGIAPQRLAPPHSPAMRNFVLEDGLLAPRSGLSRSGGTAPGGALGAWRFHDAEGYEHGLVASDRTFATIGRTGTTWSDLSYHPASGFAANPPSGTSRDVWRATSIYEPGADRHIVVATNGVDLPKVATLTASVTTLSDHTAFASLASSARAVTAVDSRLMFFNCADASGARWPQRVLWTPRGAPLSVQIADGAGFEDLMDMRGVGTAVIAERDGAVLFSDQEVWRARRRGDIYGFDFYPISKDIGAPFGRTVVSTPLGVFFLGHDLDVYVVQGDQIVPVGPEQPGTPSRIRALLQAEVADAASSWALYNRVEKRYELYYVGTDSTAGGARRALFYPLEFGVWLPQRFPIELQAGASLTDPGDPGPTWDGLSETWDDQGDSTWDAAETLGSAMYSYLVGSAGTSYRLDPAQTDDDGTVVDCRWQSHGLAHPETFGFDQLYEVWADVADAASGATATVHTSDNLGATYDASYATVRLPETPNGQVMAPTNLSARAPVFEWRQTGASGARLAGFDAVLRTRGRHGGGR